MLPNPVFTLFPRCPRSMPEEGGEPAAEHLLLHPPDLAASDEVYDWGAVPNLDTFFTRIYR